MKSLYWRLKFYLLSLFGTKFKEVSLFNLQESTAQEVFNFVAKHLLTQNKRAFNHGCRYKICKDGKVLKCAAGCLIPDNIYSSSMEGSTWSGLTTAFPQFSSQHNELIRRLQIVHDSSSVENWSSELEQLSIKLNLKFLKL